MYQIIIIDQGVIIIDFNVNSCTCQLQSQMSLLCDFGASNLAHLYAVYFWWESVNHIASFAFDS